jgi:hypothetical protein
LAHQDRSSHTIFGLLDLDAIANHPNLKLFEASFPTAFEPSHPLAILSGVGYIHDDLYQVIPIENPAVPPVPFYFLCLITGSTEVVHNFKNSFGNPFCRHFPPIIELKGKQDLESPLPAAHRSLFPLR